MRWRLTLAGGIFLASIALIEIAGRQLVPRPPDRDEPLQGTELVFHEARGWALPPSTTLNWMGLPATINSLGLRGPEPTSPAPGEADPLRILILGDSTVFGHGVSDEAVFARRLELLLAVTRSADVQNGGVPGYTCQQSLQLFDDVVKRFTPDILAIYSLHSDRRAVLSHDRLFLGSGLGLLSRTGVVRLASVAAFRLRTRIAWPHTPLDAYATCLSTLVERQAAHGRQAIMVIPIADVDIPPAYHPEMPEPGKVGTRMLDYRNAMLEVATREGCPLVDLPNAFRGSGLPLSAALLDQVHPTARGHDIIAQAVYTKLASDEFVNSSRTPTPQ